MMQHYLDTKKDYKEDCDCLDVFEFNMFKWAVENNLPVDSSKHLQEESHEKFAKFLLEHYLRHKL